MNNKIYIYIYITSYLVLITRVSEASASTKSKLQRTEQVVTREAVRCRQKRIRSADTPASQDFPAGAGRPAEQGT